MFKGPKSPTIFYGWFVVAASFGLTLTLGEIFWSFGVFFKPLASEFPSWSRALISSGYTALQIGYAISVFVAGRLADRYNPRPILLVSAFLAGLGISLCSQIHSIDQLRFSLFVAGMGSGAMYSVPTSTVQRWFHEKHRAGLALSIVIAGAGVGALIFAPLINHWILSYGWRNAYLIVGILFFSVSCLSSLVIRRSPMDTATIASRKESISKSASTQGWKTGKVVTTTSFWGITFAIAVASLAFNALSVHLVPHATDLGISPTVSAAALGLLGGFSIVGRIASGPVSDRIGWRKTLASSLFGMALTMVWLLFLKATWMLFGFSFLWAIPYGMQLPARPGILCQFFGMHSLGELIGITAAMGSVVGALGPYMAGFIFDKTGSYFMAFIIVIAFMFSAAFVATRIKEPPITSK